MAPWIFGGGWSGLGEKKWLNEVGNVLRVKFCGFKFHCCEAIMAISNKKLQKIMTLGNFITQLVPQAGSSQRLLGFFIAASFLRLLIGHGAVDRVQLLTIWTCWFIKRFSMLVHRCQDLITAVLGRSPSTRSLDTFRIDREYRCGLDVSNGEE